MRTQQWKLFRLVGLGLLGALALSLGGCPPPVNQNPVANAGPDQTVAPGAVVTLTGAASTDPDGDALTYAWTQTVGTPVTLTGATAVTASFTAPATAQTLAFQLTVNDGRGGTATDTVSILVQAGGPPPAPPRLYIANIVGNNITSYSNPRTVNGNIPPDANLAGAQTQLSQPTDIIVNAAGELMASNFLTNAVTTYGDAATANGNFPPDRNVQGAATGLTGPSTLAVNATNDLLFVANYLGAPDNIAVYTGASQVAFNGNIAPTRVIRSADINNPVGINFGAADNLYVANQALANVAVFANASNLNGTVAATRLLTSALFAGIFDVYVDPADRLYVVVGPAGGNRVHIFNNASTLNGAVTPNFTITVTGAINLTAIAVDSANTGYIVDTTRNAVYSYDNIATRNGTLPPDRLILGAQTQLTGPIRVFLDE